MAGEWRRFCSGRKFAIEGDDIVVTLPGSRTHRVSVREEPDAYRLSSVVARPAVVEQIVNLPIQSWERNRGTELAGFKIDSRGRLISESWIPKAGLTAAEFTLYLQSLASEADRFEYQLTGRDSD
ncbi:MAG: hypothetical protein AB1452_06475 [Pseudomonadota bacterium]